VGEEWEKREREKETEVGSQVWPLAVKFLVT
jgi:hypothetical protein